MAHPQQQEFCKRIKSLYPQYFKNKKVLDIGSLDINGSNKFLFEDCDYLGLDVAEGKNVDIVSVGHLFNAPDNFYDVIICTEVFEHDMFYEKTIQNIIRMLKPNGMFLFTCASTGREEHGTIKSDNSFAAPLLIKISENWANYYKNLIEDDIKKIDGFNKNFPDGYFEYEGTNFDLYFFGIKGGMNNLLYKEFPTPICNKFNNDHIFFIDAWVDTPEKQNMLINCIHVLKLFNNIEILLITHNPIIPEIQKMVDYYIYDKQNPLLTYKDFDKYEIGSGRWSGTSYYKTEIKYKFHHDFAIWRTLDIGFDFCKLLNKKYIHFLEYDNLPDPFQYRQAFLENIYDFDAVIYEYKNYSKDSHLDEYCATFIFSIKTDIAIKMTKNIKSIEDYFFNKPKGFQLERVFLSELRKQTANIFVSPYIANENELNIFSVWNRDGEVRFETKFQAYPCVDEYSNLYLELIHEFHEKNEFNKKSYLLEIIYKDFKKFIELNPDEFKLIKLGKYSKGERLIINYMGREIFNTFFDMEFNEYKFLNLIKKYDDDMKININFIDGAYCEMISSIQDEYKIEFINNDTNEIIYETRLNNNCWAKASKKYFINWKINIKHGSNLIKSYSLNLQDQRVYIAFDSNSLGDTLAWFPYAEEFRKKHNCKVIVSTFWNDLFKNKYPHLTFVNPGETVYDIIAMYTVGIFYDKDNIDLNKMPWDFKDKPLQKLSADILGLEYKEIKPEIELFDGIEKENIITIAVHSTCQAKYWNNQNGWQEVVDYLKSKGYRVVLLSSEEDGYMGNNNPKGAEIHPKGHINEVIKLLQKSKLFIGISSGLSWLSWGIGTPTCIISGFTEPNLEFNCIRIYPELSVCNGCHSKYKFDPGDWNWCPEHKNTDRQFECTKTISSEKVIKSIEKLI